MFFENRDDIHIFERIVSQLKNHTILPSSNLVRNDESYFTFSPFQDTEQFFIKKSLNSGIKKQFCVRYINKLDLTNPLCLNSQLTITIQNYNRINQVSEMEKIIKIIFFQICNHKKCIFQRNYRIYGFNFCRIKRI